ncbi:competence protein ComEC, partial [Methylobacterium sp. WL6]
MPSLWAPLVAAGACAATLPFLGARPAALAVALGLMAALLGFAASALRVAQVAAPVLTRTIIAPLEGLIESLEERE